MTPKPADPTAAGITMLLSLGHKPVASPQPIPADPPQTPPPAAARQ
jgi:hypothetical protein